MTIRRKGSRVRGTDVPRSPSQPPFMLDRSGNVSLVEQLRHRIEDAIFEGTLALGARLPSWSDLASQLGVARGTVRQAYAELADAQLIVTAGAKGTRVSARPPGRRDSGVVSRREQAGFPYFALEPLPLQIGVPSQAAFPVALWTRLGHRAMRETLNLSVGYPDPCGEPGLRREIASHLALARGLACDPAQITNSASANARSRSRKSSGSSIMSRAWARTCRGSVRVSTRGACIQQGHSSSGSGE
jgi:DNA-binding transcriptional regulator YhcF (GntR family)